MTLSLGASTVNYDKIGLVRVYYSTSAFNPTSLGTRIDDNNSGGGGGGYYFTSEHAGREHGHQHVHDQHQVRTTTSQSYSTSMPARTPRRPRPWKSPPWSTVQTVPAPAASHDPLGAIATS